MAVAIARTATGAGTAAQPSVISAVAIGVAASDRVTVLAWTSELASGSPNSVTIDFGGGAVAMTAGPLGTLAGGAVFARLFWLPTPTGTTATFSVTTGATVATTNHQYSVYRVVGASATCSSCGTASSTDMDATSPLTARISIPTNGGLIAVASGATASTTAKTWAGATEDQEVSVTAYCHTTAMSTTASTDGTTTLTCTGGTNGEDGALAWIVFREAAPAVGAFVGGTVATLGSITNPFPTISSMGVDAGDLIVAAVQEQTGVTTTAIGDGLGNNFTALTAGALIKPFYLIAPAAGTITPFATTTGSAHDAAIGVAVFKGPIDAFALDLNPAVLTDSSTPYAANATGTRTQANEVLIGYFGSSASDVYNTPLPAGAAINVQGAIANASVAFSSLIVAANTTQTFSVAGVTGNLSTGCGSATFKIGSKGVALAAGPSATTAANTATVAGKANVSIGSESAAASTAVNTVTVSVSANVTLTGASASSALGSLSVSTVAPIAADNWAGIAAVPVAAASVAAPVVFQPAAAGVNVNVTGVAASGVANFPTVTGLANVSLTGTAASGVANFPTVQGKANVTLTGTFATGIENFPTVQAKANVSLTGVFATGIANFPTVTGFANVNITGVFATGQVGDVTVTVGGGVSVNINGVFATGQAGDVTVQAKANVTLTGAQASGIANFPTVSAKGNIFLSGAEATGIAGTVTVSGKANVTLTGVLATSAANTVTVSGKVNVPLTGVFATGIANFPTVQGKANVSQTGTFATGQAGDVTVQGKANVTINGVQATGAVNTVTVNAQASAALTGVASTGLAGTVTVSGFANVSLTGVEASGQIGSITVTAGGSISVNINGVEATGVAGTPTVNGKANVTLTGAAATAAAGTAAAAIPINVLLSGAAANGDFGSLIATGDAIVIPDGVQATGQSGTPTVHTAADERVNLIGVSATAIAGPLGAHTKLLSLQDERAQDAELYELFQYQCVDAGAFQIDAFQNDAFQVSGEVCTSLPKTEDRLYDLKVRQPILYENP